MRDAVIILTGTVEPNVGFVARKDVAARIRDYAKCIEFYLADTNLPILFAENSGFDPDSEPAFKSFLNHPRFRWESVSCHPDTSKGKGFQEFYMLDQLVERSLAGDYFVKVTGRYLVRNAARIISQMRDPMHIDMHRKMKVAITGFFGAETEFYRQNLFGKYTLANDEEGRFIEHVVYDALKDKDSVSLLPQNPNYEGISGSHGASMERNPYKMKLRSLERTINRSLGIRKFLIEY